MRLAAYLTVLLSSSASALSTSPKLLARQYCEAGYQACTPAGEQSASTPDIGGSLAPLYVDLLDSISGQSTSKRATVESANILDVRDANNPVCCIAGTQCLLVQQLKIPFCYDHFTTNYFLPDGAYGTVITGDYTAPDGSHANLLTGDFELQNGTTGNLYSRLESEQPNTATLTMPTPYTSNGVGSAIVASALGALKTYTTTIPATTVQAVTRSEQTIPATEISGSSFSASTIPATTVGATTMAAITSVVTTSFVTTTVSETVTAGKASESGAAPALCSKVLLGWLPMVFGLLLFTL